MRIICILLLPVLLSGCIASVAADVVTAPVKVAGKVIDATTTSQAEADQKRGREARKAEKKARKDAKRKN
ncbi:MAG: hypothetical protein RLZZ561_910 [Pseudomonadota bacterium]|jgi:hypothetical protein